MKKSDDKKKERKKMQGMKEKKQKIEENERKSPERQRKHRKTTEKHSYCIPQTGNRKKQRRKEGKTELADQSINKQINSTPYH